MAAEVTCMELALFIIALVGFFYVGGFRGILMLLVSLFRLITRSGKPILAIWRKPVVTKSFSGKLSSPKEELKRWGSRSVSAIVSVCSEASFNVNVGAYPNDLEVERTSFRQRFKAAHVGDRRVLPDVTPSMLKECLICEPIDPLMSGTLVIEMPIISLEIPNPPRKPVIEGNIFDTAETEKTLQKLEGATLSIEPEYGSLTGHTDRWYRDTHEKEYRLFVGEQKEYRTIVEETKTLLNLQRQYNEKFCLAEAETNRSFEDASRRHSELTLRFHNLLSAEKAKALAFVSNLKSEAEEVKKGFESGTYKGVETYFNKFLIRLPLPNFICKDWEIHYDETSQILLVDYKFLTFAQVNFCKPVQLKSGETRKPLNKGETKAISAAFYPSITLRLAKEIINHDLANLVQAICVNGWVNHRDGATGQEKRAYVSSLFAKKEDLVSISLENVDPVKCFESLKGRVIRTETLEIAPVNPVIHFDKSDKRFVEGRDVLDAMIEGQNLAAIEWEDFEHLVRELFSKLFSRPGAEVRVTQASRDKGVDAVVFDPTPITGGKFVIQAKRYVNVVDVSAVRDLYGTLMNEGASKGILVTTSNYGADSYEFAKNKPINLINGAELLGLLEAHGYKARIDLEEARRLAAGQPLRG